MNKKEKKFARTSNWLRLTLVMKGSEEERGENSNRISEIVMQFLKFKVCCRILEN